MGRLGRAAVVALLVGGCGPSVSNDGASSASSGVAGTSDGVPSTSSGTSTETSTTTSSTAGTTDAGASSGERCPGLPEGSEVELEGPVYYSSGALWSEAVYLVPCSMPEASYLLEGDVLGLIPCCGAYGRVRGSVTYPADPCYPSIVVAEVLESREAEPGDCGSVDCQKGLCPVLVACSVWEQDCPADTKCGPTISRYRAVYDGVDCSAHEEMPGAPGDACQVYDLGRGQDSCERGVMCTGSDDAGQGICTQLCDGTEANPSCPVDRVCVMTNRVNGNVLPLCLEPCDPVAPMCAAGSSCVSRDDQFVCLDDDDLNRIIDEL